MKSRTKYLVLVATLYPVIWIVCYALSVFEPINWPVQIGLLLIIGVATILVYLRAILRNESLSRSQKVMWIFLLSLFGTITQLVYYISYFRSK